MIMCESDFALIVSQVSKFYFACRKLVELQKLLKLLKIAQIAAKQGWEQEAARSA